MTRKLYAFLALALTALVPATARADLPTGFVGISPQGVTRATDYRLMGDAGMTSVRLPLFWSSVQPVSPRTAAANWTSFDGAVELAAEARLRVFPFFYGSPSWVASEGRALPVRSARQRRAWANFVRAAVRRYGAGGTFWATHPELPYLPFRRWEIWNESNIVSFMRNPDPTSYARLLRIAGRTLHREDPDAEVLVGGLFGRPLQIPPNVASGAFLAGIYRAGRVKRFFDGVALHPYVADVRGMTGQLRNLRRIMRRHGDARTPIYLTELGWGSRGGPTRWERGLYGQANQLSRAFRLVSRHRRGWRLGGVWWFTWSDEGGTCQFCSSAGLLTAEREAKPSWYRFVAWTGGDPDVVPRARLGD
ncbi:MAG: hypothetical protein R2725_00990 [Solirubrobacterales bacterium]